MTRNNVYFKFFTIASKPKYQEFSQLYYHHLRIRILPQVPAFSCKFAEEPSQEDNAAGWMQLQNFFLSKCMKGCWIWPLRNVHLHECVRVVFIWKPDPPWTDSRSGFASFYLNPKLVQTFSLHDLWKVKGTVLAEWVGIQPSSSHFTVNHNRASNFSHTDWKFHPLPLKKIIIKWSVCVTQCK